MTKYQEDLVNNNIKLVYKITSGFRVPPSDRNDLIQEGFYALCLAAKRFDPMRGDAFTTYAYSYILGRCKFFISRNSIIKPSRSKESGYKKFVTYETPSLDDYLCVADPRSDIMFPEIDGVIDALKESEGEIVSQVALLCSKGLKQKDISKDLGIRVSEVNAIICNLRENEFINNLLRSVYGTDGDDSTQETWKET